jgi:hypothetical protein
LPSEATILVYYGKLRDEITRYRNLEWQITAYLAAVLAFLFGLIAGGDVIDTSSTWLVRAAWTSLLTGVGTFGIYALSYVHSALNKRRDEAVRLEIWLGLYATVRPDQRVVDSGLFTLGEMQSAVVRQPRRYRGFVEGGGVWFVVAFMAFICVLCGVCIVRLWTL